MALPFDRSGAEAPLERDLETAVGLVWGHLASHQFRQAATLARGCLEVWPAQPLLLLLGANAASELGEPLTPQVRALLDRPAYAGLGALVLRRAAGAGRAGKEPA